MSYFSQPKTDATTATKPAATPVAAPSRFEPAPANKAVTEAVSTLGEGMLITGNIKCAGSVHVYGRVIGDIHAAQLTICEGAKVEGKVMAADTVIRGTFNGTVQSHSVKLTATAVVDGEIFNKSLTIETNAQFEGVARRLDAPVTTPTLDDVNGTKPVAPAPYIAPVQQQYAPAPQVSPISAQIVEIVHSNHG